MFGTAMIDYWRVAMFFSYRCNAKNVPTGLGLEVLGLSDYVGQERAEHGVHTTGIDESGKSLRGQGGFFRQL